MDAPPIQYARSEDGVNIAYAVVDRGPPLVFLSAVGWSHLDLEWRFPPARLLRGAG